MTHPYNEIKSVKRNEALIYAEAWINFENAMLSERSHTQKIK